MELHRLKMVIGRFWPHPMAVGRREVVFSCLGAALGLVITERIGHYFMGTANPWFIAPMGASAVLLFGVPASPLAQPWSIVGGNLVAAMVGVTIAALVPMPGLASGLAVAIAIAAMFRLRCLHPPSGAVALTAVLGGPAIQHLGYGFVWCPVLLNSLSLTGLALLINNTVGRRYPHQLAPGDKVIAPPIEATAITRADLHAAMADGELFDIDEDDLEMLLHRAEQHAHQRRAGTPVALPHPAKKRSREVASAVRRSDRD